LEVKKPVVYTQNNQPNLFYNLNELDVRLGLLHKYVTGIKTSNHTAGFSLDEIDEHLKDISTTINALVQYQSFALEKAKQMRKQDWKSQQFNSDFDYPVKVLKEHAKVV